jgi:hypothetical protein
VLEALAAQLAITVEQTEKVLILESCWVLQELVEELRLKERQTGRLELADMVLLLEVVWVADRYF